MSKSKTFNTFITILDNVCVSFSGQTKSLMMLSYYIQIQRFLETYCVWYETSFGVEYVLKCVLENTHAP